MKENIKGVLHKKNIYLKKYNNFKIEAKALNFYIPENINGFINLLFHILYTYILPFDENLALKSASASHASTAVIPRLSR